jgi:hypothetical protein
LKLVPAGQIGAEDVAAPSHISVVGLKLVPKGHVGGSSQRPVEGLRKVPEGQLAGKCELRKTQSPEAKE